MRVIALLRGLMVAPARGSTAGPGYTGEGRRGIIGGPCEAFFEWGGVKRSEAESPPTQKRRSSVHWNETAARALVSGYGGPIVVWPGCM